MSKQVIKEHWDNEPCGTRNMSFDEEAKLRENFEKIEKRRYQLEHCIFKYAQFEKWQGKDVLEVGCGAGTDHLQFARAGANTTAIDLSSKSASLTKTRLQLYGFQGSVFNGDAENLPFKDNSFDLVYSWGVLHSTPDTEKSIREVHRVCRPGGNICIMLYNRHSFVALQIYLVYGLLSLKPFQSVGETIEKNLESPGTKAYTVAEVQKMFAMFEDVKIDTVFTPYDLRLWRDSYLPQWLGRLFPKRWGWFIVIQGRKP